MNLFGRYQERLQEKRAIVLKLKNQLRLTQDLERNSGEERPNGSNSQRTKGMIKTYENPIVRRRREGKR